MMASVIEGEKMRQELEIAREVQLSTLPAAMPTVPGYDTHGFFQPAGADRRRHLRSGADRAGLLIVLGDATGHGIGPALSVTQMQAMLKMAFRLGADLETAFMEVNNLLADTLAEDRFVTAFIGLLDPESHTRALHQRRTGPDPAIPRRARRMLAPPAQLLSARRDGAGRAAAAGQLWCWPPATC